VKKKLVDPFLLEHNKKAVLTVNRRELRLCTLPCTDDFSFCKLRENKRLANLCMTVWLDKNTCSKDSMRWNLI